MLEIAGGIVLAVIILAALPAILFIAFWCLLFFGPAAAGLAIGALAFPPNGGLIGMMIGFIIGFYLVNKI